MKKSLVLAMAMALGVTASAYAANPFSDVPAGHWAYDSVNKLAAAGIVDGYGNGTFGGDRLMTRYEMAQIVAKAMAKGANVDRLAAEFADELDSLGVRVAALEKKSDNVKITGEARFLYADHDNKDMGGDKDHYYEATLRSRVWLTGQINEDWTYTGMIQNTQDFANDAGDENTSFQRAYVQGKLGGMAVTAGRYNMFLANGNIYDTRADGIELAYGDKVKVTGVAGRASDDIYTDLAIDLGGLDAKGHYTPHTYVGGALEADFGAINATAGYYNFKDILGSGSNVDNGIWFVGAGTNFGDFGLNAMYLKGDLSGVNKNIEKALDDDGWTVGLTWKGAEADKAGSYGLFANYYDQGAQTYIAHTTDANTFDGLGFKGYGVGANYTVAKNMVFTAVYYDTEAKATGDKAKDKIIWTDLTFTF